MKNSTSHQTSSHKNKVTKTALDSFTLFYEEIPMDLENRPIKTEARRQDRLVRRSRIK